MCDVKIKKISKLDAYLMLEELCDLLLNMISNALDRKISYRSHIVFRQEEVDYVSIIFKLSLLECEGFLDLVKKSWKESLSSVFLNPHVWFKDKIRRFKGVFRECIK